MDKPLFVGKLTSWAKTNFALIILLFFLSALYFILRLIAIRDLPLFTDEAIYIRWAQMGYYDAGQRLTSLSDGKQPLFIWLITLFMNAISNPLAAGRIVSVLTGFMTAIGLYILTFNLFRNKWGSILAVSIYVVLPFALIYDRMALYESTSGMFFIWSLLGGIVLTNKLQLQYSFILAFIIGGGILTKTTGFLSIYLLPLLLFLLPVTKTNRAQRLFAWTGHIAITVGVAFLYYSILRLSPHFSQISEKNAIFLYHIRELIPYGALNQWAPNLQTLTYWLAQYASIPVFIVFIASFFFIKVNLRQKTVLLLWFVIPFAGYGLLGRQLNPRYLYPIILPLIPLFAANLVDSYNKIRFKKIILTTTVACIASMLYVDYRVITSFASSPIPSEDLNQYINGVPSGGGIRESLFFLLEKAKEGPMYIATEGVYGSLPTTAVELYFLHHPSIQKKGFEVSVRIPKQLIEKTYEMPVYVIFNRTQTPPAWPMELIAKYQKGISNNYLSLYKLQKISLNRCASYLQEDKITSIEECE